MPSMDYLDQLCSEAFNARPEFARMSQPDRAAARLAFVAGWNAAMNEAAAALRHPDAAGVVLAGSDLSGRVPQ